MWAGVRCAPATRHRAGRVERVFNQPSHMPIRGRGGRTRTREDYIPADAEKQERADAVVYTYATRRGPGAVAFVGRATKPRWHFVFPSEARRDEHIQQLFAERAHVADERARAKAEKARPHTVQEGDFLVDSWGYEQTNVDWFQVTRLVAGSTVEARPVESAQIRAGELAMSGTCTPIPDRFVGATRRFRVDGRNSVRTGERRRAELWDGRPRYWSDYA